MTTNYTNRGFLDLENYNSKEAIEIMHRKLKSHPEYIERVGDRIYFNFKTIFNKANFFMTITRTLHQQGYMTEVLEETDQYELIKLNKKAKVCMNNSLYSSRKKRRKRISKAS